MMRRHDKLMLQEVQDAWYIVGVGGIPPVIDPPSGDGDNDDMEARVRILEQTMTDVRERLARIETRVDQTVTKEDAARMETSIIKWFIGTAAVLSALAFTAAAVVK